jgi:hypothetical protein
LPIFCLVITHDHSWTTANPKAFGLPHRESSSDPEVALLFFSPGDWVVAQVVSAGSSFASLYERETSLPRVLAELGLEPLSLGDEAAIRSELGAVIGKGLDRTAVTKKINPGAKLQTKDIVGVLRAIARDFRSHEAVLRGRQTGLRQSYEIEVAHRILEVLSKNSEIKIDADEFLRDSCDRISTISDACLIAAKALDLNKGEAGKKAIDWFDDFTRVLVNLAEKNGMRPTVENDRRTGKPKGRFFALATGIERLLYPEMRSPSPSALAKRLSRSLARLKHGRD